jgi:predicted Fe-Mo cluster-binding NifX family protein
MEGSMKIAFITDDGKTISRHFGRAPYYLVLDIKNGQEVNRELRDKLGHAHYSSEAQRHEGQLGSGMDSASHSKHQEMAKSISDCDVLICGGMGRGAYQSMQTEGIKPVVTDLEDIEIALQNYLEGKLKDQTEKLH